MRDRSMNGQSKHTQTRWLIRWLIAINPFSCASRYAQANCSLTIACDNRSTAAYCSQVERIWRTHTQFTVNRCGRQILSDWSGRSRFADGRTRHSKNELDKQLPISASAYHQRFAKCEFCPSLSLAKFSHQQNDRSRLQSETLERICSRRARWTSVYSSHYSIFQWI